MTTEQIAVEDLVFRLRRSARRHNIGITVERDGQLTVSAPSQAPQARVEAAVRSRLFWVYEKLSLRDLNQRRQEERAYTTGESYAYLGRSYRLQILPPVQPDQAAVGLYGGRLILRSDRQGRAFHHLRDWYRQRGQAWLPERSQAWIDRLQLQPSGIQVRDLKNRWGSCTPTGEINFHWQVMTLPPSVIDYIIVHELAHLEHRNHTPAFWGLVERTMPDYPRRKDRLSHHGGGYVL
ncbi:MAG: M48 family peptidase [Planctomycetota bacterium]|nr:MAG: M48 family peptidase [Planctomycetota bacterium]